MRGIERFLEATAAAPPWAGNPLPEKELQDFLERALFASGCSADSCQLVILIGCQGGAMVRKVVATLPAVQKILVLEPDLSSLRALLLAMQAGDHGLGVVEIGEAVLARPPLPASLYLLVIGFLIKHNLPMAAVLVWEDAAGGGEERLAYPAVAAVVQDLFQNFSSALLQLVPRVPGAIPLSFVRLWARYLEKNHLSFHAAKCYHLLVAADMIRGGEARDLLQLWVRLGCLELALPLLDRAVADPQSRESLRDHLLAIHHTRQQQEAVLLRVNQGVLQERYPDLARDMVLQPTGPGLYCAMQTCVVRNSRPLTPEACNTPMEFPILFRVTPEGIQELNRPVGDVLAMLRTLSRELFNSHMLVCGSQHFYQILLFLWTPVRMLLPNWHQCLYLVEPDLTVLRAVLGQISLVEVFKKECLFLFYGPEGKEALFRLMARDSSRFIPNWVVGFTPEEMTRLEQLRLARWEEVQVNQSRVARLQRADHSRHLLALLQNGGRPVRMLLITSLFTTVLQYVTDDLAEAFRELGHETLVLREKDAGEGVDAVMVSRAVLSFNPDMVLCINHLRSEMSASIPADVPFICWIQDLMGHFQDRRLIDQLGKLDFHYTLTQGCKGFLDSLSYREVDVLPFGVNTRRFFPMADLPAADDRVAYITHLHEVREPAKLPGLFRWMEENYPFCLTDLDIGPPLICPKALAHFQVALDEAETREVWSAMGHHFRRMERLWFMDCLLESGFQVAVYGEGWDQIAKYRPWHCGVVANGRPLAEAYQKHKVVLHTGLNMHSRVMEAMAAGGFVVIRHDGADYLPGGLNDHLTIGEDILSFQDVPELQATIRRALSDEAWRQQVIARGRRLVLENESYRNRACQLLHSVEKRLDGLVRDILPESRKSVTHE